VQIYDSLAKSKDLPQVQEVAMNLDDNPKDKSASVTSTEETKVGPEDFMPLKLLGSGSFGEVYLVRDNKDGMLYAMKVLSK
jgi:serine/threonine protein kinase